MPDLPVAAPDHAAAIKLALESPTPYFDDEYAMFKDRRDAALAALDALLVERQQDKERIERLTEIEKAAQRLVFDPTVRSSDALDELRAALAVEEDAENG